MIGVIADEPALVTGIVSAVIILLVTFGAPITQDQSTAILGLVSAAIALIGSVIVRSRVTPTANIPAPVVTPPATGQGG